jgi:predicted dienelactone hydrolase
MHGEDAAPYDLHEVARAVDETEVVVVGFSICPERLVIDMRADDATGPLIELTEPVQSASDRAMWLAERRPSLGAPDTTVFFVWPHTVDYLGGSEVLTRIRDRVQREYGIEVQSDMSRVLGELRDRESDHTRLAVLGGEGFETLWKREDQTPTG